MNKVLKGLVAVAATAAMAVAGFAGASTAMAAEGTHTVTISRPSLDTRTRHTRFSLATLAQTVPWAMLYGVLALTRASLLLKALML